MDCTTSLNLGYHSNSFIVNKSDNSNHRPLQGTGPALWQYGIMEALWHNGSPLAVYSDNHGNSGEYLGIQSLLSSTKL
jgi:hypothetical protein